MDNIQITSIIIGSVSFLLLLGGMILRTIEIRRWIKLYCFHLAFDDFITPTSIGLVTNRSVEVTWNKNLWHRNEAERRTIIREAVSTAFLEYYRIFNLQQKAIQDVTVRAVKQNTFHKCLSILHCNKQQWGARIEITYTNLPMQIELKVSDTLPQDANLSETTTPEPVEIIRQIVVLKHA